MKPKVYKSRVLNRWLIKSCGVSWNFTFSSLEEAINFVLNLSK